MSPWLVAMVACDMSARLAARELEAQAVAGVDRLDHALGLVGGDLEQREVLEKPDVADVLAVEPGAVHRGDQVALAEALGAAGAGDQGAVGAVGRHGLGVARLAMAARPALA